MFLKETFKHQFSTFCCLIGLIVHSQSYFKRGQFDLSHVFTTHFGNITIAITFSKCKQLVKIIFDTFLFFFWGPNDCSTLHYYLQPSYHTQAQLSWFITSLRYIYGPFGTIYLQNHIIFQFYLQFQNKYHLKKKVGQKQHYISRELSMA